MSLQNIFAVSACDVGVYFNGTHLWDGVLAPGQSSTQFPGHQNTEVLQVVVNSDGTVQLNWISGAGPSQGYVIAIQPFFNLHTASQIVVQQISIPNGVSASACCAANFALTPQVQLTGSGSTWTPDPCDITSTLGSTPGIYVFQGQIA